jgi:hypothetical protein
MAQSLFVARGGPFGQAAAAVLIAAALVVKFEAGDATTRNTSHTHRDGREPPSKRHRDPLHPEIRSLEQESGSCAYGCEQPCDTSCRSAFAVCTQGGTLDPICTSTNGSNATDTSAAGGWVNPINCTGGSLLCDVVLASPTPSLCNASSDVGEPLGSVILDTDSSSVQFALTDPNFQLASVDLYLGSGPDLSGNDSFAMHSWYYPYVRQAIMPLSISRSISPGTFFTAHASVCWGSTSTPTASPSTNGSPVLALDPQPTLPRCSASPAAPSSSIQPTSSDVASMSSTSNATPKPSIATRRRRRRRRLQSLEVRNAMCPNQCQPGQLQACDSTCRSAWAYCNTTDTSTAPPTCVFHNRTNQSSQSSMSWTNPIPCFGSFECDLYLILNLDNRDCAIDEAAGDLWIGKVWIDTDARSCTLNITASNYSISSARARGFAGSADSSDTFVTNSTQSVWFDGLPKVAYLPVGLHGMDSGAFSFAAHALICPDPDRFSPASATIPTSSEAKNKSQIYQVCPLFPRAAPTYELSPSFVDTSAPSQAPFTLAQLLASAVTEGADIVVSGLLGISPPSSGTNMPLANPRSAPQTPQVPGPPRTSPPTSEPSPQAGLHTLEPSVKPTVEPTPFTGFLTDPPRTGVPTEEPSPFSTGYPTVSSRPSSSPLPSSTPTSSPKPSVSSDPTKLYPTFSPTGGSPSFPPTNQSPSFDAATALEQSNTPYQSKANADPPGSASSSVPTQIPHALYPLSLTHVRATSLPSTTPVSRLGAQDRSATPFQGLTVLTSAPSFKPTPFDAYKPSRSPPTSPKTTSDPVAPPTHEPTATSVAEPSYSPQESPRKDPGKTHGPSMDTSSEAGEDTSRTRRVKDTRGERDFDATCSLAYVHCGSACRCGQLRETKPQIELGKYEPSGETESSFWNEIGGVGMLTCNLLVFASSEMDCGILRQGSVVGQVEVNPGSGVLSASFFWDRRLQGNISPASSLPVVYFTQLDVIDATLRQPIVARTAVEWADEALGTREPHATGRFSINVAVHEGFHAYVSFCET